jgi:hypothetical protein
MTLAEVAIGRTLTLAWRAVNHFAYQAESRARGFRGGKINKRWENAAARCGF